MERQRARLSASTRLPEIARPAGYEARTHRRITDAKDGAPGLRVKNLTTNTGDPTVTELWIYDYIDWLGVTAEAVVAALMGVTTDEIRVRINSPGGDVFDGIAIMNALASNPARVTVVIDSLCASIATVIAMAGETITMSPGSQMMIHPASGVCFGDAVDMRKLADILDFQTSNIAGLYANRSGGDAKTWLAAMNDETWYSADEAVAAGLADAVGVVKQGGAQALPAEPEPDQDDMWDLTVFKFAGRAKAPAPAPAAPASRCQCGPGSRPLSQRMPHLANCAKYPGHPGDGITNLPAPVGVQWEVISNGVACEEICEPIIDASPYDEDDLPDIPAHPNCDCELQVAYGVDNTTHHKPHTVTDPFTDHFTSWAAAAEKNADDSVRRSLKEVLV